jgi:thiol-disulfide isomerase/thioredoxin
MSTVQVFHFWSPDCKPCMHLKPLFEDLEEEFGDPKYVWSHIDVSSDTLRPLKMNVKHIPCLLTYKNGREVGRHVGTEAARYYAILRAAGKD